MIRDLVTIDTAASLLGVSRRSVYTLITRGELETVRYGTVRVRRVKRGSIDAFIDRHTERRLGRRGARRAARSR